MTPSARASVPVFPVLAYRLLLWLYPRPFRRKHGADMVQLFRDRYRELRPGGGTRFRRFVIAAVTDAIVQGPAERLARFRGRRSRGVASVRGGGSPDPSSRPGSPWQWGEGVVRDLQYAFRSLRRSPGLVAAAVASLGLGIGAATTVFSGVDVFMFRPLPLPEADRLFVLFTTNPDRGWSRVSLSLPDFDDYRERVASLDIAAYDSRGYSLSYAEEPERLNGQMVSANFFRVIGTTPALGRDFSPEEEQPGRHRVAIVSDGLWRRRLGGDPDVIGHTVILDGEPYTIVGVLPSDSWFGRWPVDIWTPLVRRGDEPRNAHGLATIVRLRPGVTPDVAATEVDRTAAQIAEAHPETSAGNGARITSYRGEIFDEGFRQGSTIAAVGVVFVLLIACANVANLFLTRAAGRRREIAVRAALGASKGRLVRQLLTEAIVVGLVGGTLGVGLAVLGMKGMVSVMPADFPRVDQIGLDGRVLVFAAVISILTGVLFGLAPAVGGSRPELTDSLKEGGRTGSGRGGLRTRRVLVVAEVSLAFMLLVSSALLVQAFLRLQTEDLGFQRDDLLTFRITVNERAYPDSVSIIELHRSLLDGIRALPGVRDVSGTTYLPTRGETLTYYSIPGEDLAEDERQPVVSFRYVFPNYFRTFDIPIIAGRDITDRDVIGQPQTVVINEAMAERHWPGQRVIGQQIRLSSGLREVVGVARDARLADPGDEPEPMIFLAAFQRGVPTMSVAVRTTGSAAGLTASIRERVHQIDPDLPLYDIAEMDELIATRFREDAVMAKIMGTMAVVALLLSLVGVYGVMAHTVAQRAQEVGIRMALGASARDVVAMMIRHGTWLAATGIGAGLLLTLGVTKGLSFFLYGMSPFHAATFGLTTLVLLAACLVASFLPARRASRVDPVTSLRAE